MDKIICVGKNYLEHAKELGDQVPEMPVLFLKPPSVAVVAQDQGQTVEVPLPQGRGAIHYECEIIVRLNGSGAIDAVSLGLDLTLRDVQSDLKKKGHPWEIGKVFRGSAVLGPWIRLLSFENYLDEEFIFKVDGVVRQKAKGKEMRLLPEPCINYTKGFFPICAGDVVFTGTPAGVGPILPGQIAELSWGHHLRYTVHFKT